MPRSRSSSMESSTCSRISRCGTVSVSSRIRSARVDFPWSMCATMEKLRIRSSCMALTGSTGTADEREEHVQLADPDEPSKREEDSHRRDDSEPDGDHLRAERPAERLVESEPRSVRRAGGQRRGDRDSSVRRCERAPFHAPVPAADVIEERRRAGDVHERRSERYSPDSNAVEDRVESHVESEV